MKIGKLELFYQTTDWKLLREEVLDFFHHECQHCLAKGKLTTEDLSVHHVNEVRLHPELAMSRYYVDEYGVRRPNLIPL